LYICLAGDDDVLMVDVESLGGVARSGRRRRSAEERRRIVEETLEAGSSVARVARRHGINANQVFQWRRLCRSGALGASPAGELKLLPVSISDESALAKPLESHSARVGAIHVELPGRGLISLEGDLDPAVVRAVLESLRA
jgi:transposase